MAINHTAQAAWPPSGAREVAHIGETLKLPDGRRLGFAAHGDPDGVPCFYFHGFPGSRLEAGLLPVPGLRLIGIDRPGYGLSDAKPGRRLGDWPSDIARLADHLELERFAVLGVSGGAPYAAACAHALADRLLTTVLLCGLGPPEAPGMAGGRLKTLLSLGRNTLARAAVPAIARRLLLSDRLHARLVRARKGHIASRTEGVPREREALSDKVIAFMINSWREGLRRTSSGMASDARIYGEPWPFRLSDIKGQVHLWHGRADRVVPHGIGEHYAANVPKITARFREGEGHFSIIFNSLDEIIGAIRAAA